MVITGGRLNIPKDSDGLKFYYIEKDCMFCLEHRSNVIFETCFHVNICESCYEKYQKCSLCQM